MKEYLILGDDNKWKWYRALSDKKDIKGAVKEILKETDEIGAELETLYVYEAKEIIRIMVDES